MRNTLLKTLSILIWIWFLISSVLFTPIILFLWIFTFWFDRNLRTVHRFSCFWGAQYIWINPLWSLKITNRRKIDDKKPFILISNHQSLADILVIYSLFKHFRWTSKAENFQLPFVGWVLSLNRSIKVYRSSSDAYLKFKKQAGKALLAGNSLMIFPEGTRSPHGNLTRFKDGAFLLAHELKAGIHPMVLDGTAKAIPKKGWSLRGKQRIFLEVLNPVPYEKFQHLSVAETRTHFEDMIRYELQSLRKHTHQ